MDIKSENQTELDIYFYWITNGIKYGTPINLESGKELFSNFFIHDVKLPCETITSQAFDCFKWLFINLNAICYSIGTKNSRYSLRYEKEILAFDKLVIIQLKAKNQKISDEALELVIGLLTKYSEKLLPEAINIINDFTDSLLQTIMQNQELDEFVKRGLILLKSLMQEEDDDSNLEKTQNIYTRESNGKEYKQVFFDINKNIRHLRKEVAIAYGKKLESTTLSIGEKTYSSADDRIELKSLKLY